MIWLISSSATDAAWNVYPSTEVLPTSVLYDADGKEVWRYVGDEVWTGPEAAKLLAEGGVATGG